MIPNFSRAGAVFNWTAARWKPPDLPDLHAQLGSTQTRKDDLKIAFSPEVIPKNREFLGEAAGRGVVGIVTFSHPLRSGEIER